MRNEERCPIHPHWVAEELGQRSLQKRRYTYTKWVVRWVVRWVGVQQRRHYGDYREGLCYWVVIHVCNEIHIITHTRPRLESYVNTSTNTIVHIAYLEWSGAWCDNNNCVIQPTHWTITSSLVHVHKILVLMMLYKVTGAKASWPHPP